VGTQKGEPNAQGRGQGGGGHTSKKKPLGKARNCGREGEKEERRGEEVQG